MESAVLIHPALEFLLTVLPFAPDCPTICPKSLPQTKGMGGAVVGQTFNRSWGNLGQGAKLLEETLEQDKLGRLIPLNPSFVINAHVMQF